MASKMYSKCGVCGTVLKVSGIELEKVIGVPFLRCSKCNSTWKSGAKEWKMMSFFEKILSIWLSFTVALGGVALLIASKMNIIKESADSVFGFSIIIIGMGTFLCGSKIKDILDSNKRVKEDRLNQHSSISGF